MRQTRWTSWPDWVLPPVIAVAVAAVVVSGWLTFQAPASDWARLGALESRSECVDARLARLEHGLFGQDFEDGLGCEE